MAEPQSPTRDIPARINGFLASTPYAVTEMTELSGGTANFIYRATLLQPLQNGSTEVLIKHGESFIKNSPNFSLTTSRCSVEQGCLEELSQFNIAGKTDVEDAYKYLVRTPKGFYFDVLSNTQVQEYLPSGIDLKNYALKYYPANTPESYKPQCLALGKSIGRWLKQFHSWASDPIQKHSVRPTVRQNAELQKLKHTINFEWLQGKPDLFPNVLGDAATRDVFEKVKLMAAKEVTFAKDQSYLDVIHGDFWTGNVLLPNQPIEPGKEVPIFVVDWEMAQLGRRELDMGQMIAELYELWLYKSITAGLWIIQGFTEGYGNEAEAFAYRTAIQVGAHLVCFGTSVAGWGTPEQAEMVAKTGSDLIKAGWERDGDWLAQSELACLMPGSR